MRATLPLTFVADWRLFVIYSKQAHSSFVCFMQNSLRGPFRCGVNKLKTNWLVVSFLLLDCVL